MFDLDDEFEISDEFEVTSVEFGVYGAVGQGGDQPLTVNLYTLDGVFVVENLTPIGSASIQLPDQTLTMASVPVEGAVLAGATLVVEVFVPDGRFHSRFAIGSNNLGQTGASYLRAPDCNVNQPTDLAALGYPEMHIVMNVSGNVRRSACLDDEELSWVSVSPTSDTVAPAFADELTVTFDSTGLSDGTYTGNLCIESNDPDEPVVEVPVTLEVDNAPHIEVEPTSLSATQSADETSAQVLSLSNRGPLSLQWTIDEEQTGLQLPERSLYAPRLRGEPTEIGKAPDERLTASPEAVEAFGQMRLPARGGRTLTHSMSQELMMGNSISCNTGTSTNPPRQHYENSYYRVFELATDFEITHDFTVTAVEFGVQEAIGGDGSQPVDGQIIQPRRLLCGRELDAAWGDDNQSA